MSTHAPSTQPARGRTLRMEQFEGRLVLSAATAVDAHAANVGVNFSNPSYDGTLTITVANLATQSGREGGLIFFSNSGGIATDQASFGEVLTNGTVVPRLGDDTVQPSFAGGLDLDNPSNLGVGGGIIQFPTIDPHEGEGGPIAITSPISPHPLPDPIDPEPKQGGSEEQSTKIAALSNRPLENVRVRAYWLEVASTSHQAIGSQQASSRINNATGASETEVPQSTQHTPTLRVASNAASQQRESVAMADQSPRRSQAQSQKFISNSKPTEANSQPKPSAALPTEQNDLPLVTPSPTHQQSPVPGNQSARHAAFEHYEANPRGTEIPQAILPTEDERQTSASHHSHLYGIALVALLSADHFLRRCSKAEAPSAEPSRNRKTGSRTLPS